MQAWGRRGQGAGAPWKHPSSATYFLAYDLEIRFSSNKARGRRPGAAGQGSLVRETSDGGS